MRARYPYMPSFFAAILSSLLRDWSRTLHRRLEQLLRLQEQRRIDLAVRCRRILLDLLRPRRADDGGCDIGRAQHPGERELREAQAGARRQRSRSEEHTSELQSRLHLVCRLLLE